MLRALRSSGRSKTTKLALWVLLGFLAVGLTGFGLSGAVSGLAGQNVAMVGDQQVSTDEFVRAVQQQRRAFQQQTGEPLSMDQAQQIGLDQAVLRNLISRAALYGVADDAGVSASDEMVRDRLVEDPRFQGLDGRFDQTAYEYFLRQSGLSAGEFENRLRRDLARSLVEVSVAAGARMPPVLAETLLAHQNERRGFAVIKIGAGDLEGFDPTPTENDLRAYYDENPDAYTLPERRRVTYAAVTPDMLAENLEVSDEDLRARYDQDIALYSRPERRIVDQLAFADMQAAAEARTRIEAGETSLAALAEDRGISEADLSLGPIERSALGAEARDMVFGATEPGIYGPVATDLGPSLFRVNAIIAAQETSFEDARDGLREDVALELAQDAVLDLIGPVQDTLAAGATIEELADETALALGEATLTPEPGSGIEADPAFREAAMATEPGDLPEMIELENGGLAALRVDEVIAPELQPFDEVRVRVEADWLLAQRRQALIDRAEALQARLEEGRTLQAVAEEAGLPVTGYQATTRANAPREEVGNQVLAQVFELEQGRAAVVPTEPEVTLVILTEVVPFDATDPASADQLAQIQAELDQALSRDLFNGFVAEVTNNARPTVNQSLIDSTLALYP